MALVRSFPPVATPAARVLVLGSMPGERSLTAGEYYAHPQNAFWKIMGALLGFDPQLPYAERLRSLTRCGVALWDVLGRCYREGSLDAAIRNADLEPNDFAAFLRAHPGVDAVFFNGGTAERIWRTRVAPRLPDGLHPSHAQRLPSTSPAYAAMRPEQKLQAWSAITVLLQDAPGVRASRG